MASNPVTTHKPRSVKLASLKPHPRNYRVHPEDQIEHLAQSFREHGVYRAIVIANDSTILAGHGIALAAERVGLDTVPVVRLDIPPDHPKALKVLAGDNELAHLAEIDDRQLSEILKEIGQTDEAGLLGTGYDDMMLANLVFVTRSHGEVPSLDHAAHWAGMPDYQSDEAPPQVVVSFDSEDDRDKFMALIGVTNTYKRKAGRGSWSCWWPPRERDDRHSVRYIADD